MMKAARMIRKCHARFASMLLAESQNVRLWRCRQGFPLLATVFSLLLCTFSWAIPANYPIVNTATSAYQVAGKGYSSSASATIVTDNNAGNSAPSKIELNGLTVEENSPGAIISPILVEDLDVADVHTFALSDSRFQVVSGNLKLRDGEFLDFESEPVVVITIIATDPSGETVSTIVEITVLNVNESPEDIILSNHSVDADTPGAVVGDLTIVDPDVGDTFTYAIDDVRFVIVEGQLLVSPDEFLPAGPSLSIEITVTDAGGLFYLEIFTLEVTQKFKPSEIRFSALLDGGFGLNGEGNDLAAIDIAASQCRLGTAQPAMYIESPVPRKSTSSVIAVPGLHQLVDTSVFKSGDTAFFKLIDDSANLSSVDIDLVVADIISSTGDQESIQFFETDMDSGVFAGYIQTQAIALMPNDCVLSVAESSEISIRYTDALDSTDISTAEALVDPVSVVFDSGSGRRINGVRITIVDVSTSQPADVAGDDSVSAYPASLLSGGSLVDSAGVNYSFSDGAYRFPFLKSGQYKFEVETPNRFAFPSQQPDAVLQNLVGGPYNLSLSSRGGEFVLAASGTPNIDIPLDLLPVIASDSSLELFVYAGSLGAETQNVYVEETLCRSGEQYLEQSAPITAAGLLQLPATLALVPATHVTRGEAVFIRLKDSDQDLDAYAPDQVLIEVRVSDSGETEQLLLSETGDSTGEFTGFIQSELSVGSMLDCKLGAAAGAVFDVSYQDAQDNTDSTVVSGRLDRAFTVFDSHSGQALSGVSITLVDVTTGQPALILSDDGISAYPATVVSGQSVVDSAGRQFDFMPGEFRYPALAEGDYRLELVAPPSYTYPSVLSDEEINLSPAREFTLTPASRGNDFKVLAGELLAFDLPLDPFSTEVFVTKISSQQIVSVGDFVQYSVSVENPHATGSISNLTLRDILPPGFRLVEDSSYYTGAGLGIEQIEPFISDDGRTLSYQISQLAPASKFTLKYVAHVTAGAQMGTAVNSASLSGTGVGTSNIATASVRVGEDLFQSKATIVGRVTNGGCGADAVGFSQARIFLEDGSYVVSDSEGNFHFEGVEPGTHVVQLDVASLPESHQIISCSDSTAFAGTDFSKFVDVAAGSLWRADFYLGKKPPLLEHIRSRLFSEVINEGTGQGLLNLRYILSIGDIALKNIKSVILLPEKLAFVPGSAILNDVAMDDPAGFESNALTFRMQDSSAPQILELSFQVVARAPARDVELKAVTLFETSEQPLKTPVLKNTVTLLERRPQTAAHAAEYGYKTAMHIHRPEGATSVSASINQTTSGTGIPERVDSDLRIANLKSTDAPESMARSRNVANTSPLNTLVSDFGVVEVLADRKLKVGSRITMPLLDEEIVPSFDINWLVLQNSQPEIVWPILGSNPRIPTTDVYVKHDITERIRVFIEGVEVSPLSFEGVNVVPAGTKAISRWRNIPLVNGDNHVEVQIDNGSGEPLLLSQNVHFSGSPIRAEFVPELSQLDADGLTPAVIAVRFFDRDGYPVRPGLTGSFTIEAPFKVYNEALLQSQIDPSLVQQVVEKYLVVRDGTAYIQLEPSTQTGEVKLRFEFGDNRFDEVSAR
ncbi:MAG: DUF11 domain-containing protein, partial [Pseudomonadales bacterium]|nr:DUF11 domain-containing protein [Pseudomonadales bacterium]